MSAIYIRSEADLAKFGLQVDPINPTQIIPLPLVPRSDGPLIVDPDLASLLTPHTACELATLENLLATQGCLDPIIAWEDRSIIIDGMARYEICTRRNISFRTVRIHFADMEAAREWRIRHQLARRNIPPIAASYYRGLLFKSTKRPGTRTDRTSGKNCGRSLAELHGISERTLTSDAKLATALDQLATELHDGKEFRLRVLSGRSGLTRCGVIQLAGMSLVRREDRLREVAGRIEEAKQRRQKGAETARQRRMQEAVDVKGEEANNPKKAGRKGRKTRHKVSVQPEVEADLRRLVGVWLPTCHKARQMFLARPDVRDMIQAEVPA